MTSNTQSTHILLIEDNAGDIRLMIEAFKETQTPTQVHVVGNGVDALSFLKRAENYRDVPRPALILLDLNLPRMDGFRVLAEVKNDPGLKCIPVIVLTTSMSEQDISSAYDLGANCYIGKPLDLDRFFEVVKALTDFWLKTATLPDRCI